MEIKKSYRETIALMEHRKRITETAELIIWECRERQKFQTKTECVRMALNCIAYAKVILGYV